MTLEFPADPAVDMKARLRRTAISAHRGGAGLWPENSLTAFRAVRDLDVESVEFDVHPTADGRIVVHHDAVLGRVVEGDGAVCDKRWEALRGLRFKDHPQERMPLLEEVIDLLRPSHLELRLEFKAGPDKMPYPEIVQAVHEDLVRHDMLDRTMISSFDIRYLKAVGDVAPGLHRIWLIRPAALEEAGLDHLVERAQTIGIPEIDLRAETIRADWPAHFAASDLALGGFAANDRRTIARMFELGVAMFTTDVPDLAIEVRDALSAPGV